MQNDDCFDHPPPFRSCWMLCLSVIALGLGPVADPGKGRLHPLLTHTPILHFVPLNIFTCCTYILDSPPSPPHMKILHQSLGPQLICIVCVNILVPTALYLHHCFITICFCSTIFVLCQHRNHTCVYESLFGA